MLADLFWAAATSDIAIGQIAALGVAAALVSLLPARLLPPQIGAWVLLAKIVAPVALFALGISIGHRIADEHVALRDAQFELRWKQGELDRQKEAAEDAARLADLNKERAEALQTKVDDYVEQLAKQPIGACAFDDNDLVGLRGIGGSKKSRRADPAGLRKPRR